ncbi:MAG: hypothetical protein A3B90_03185 [Candidatus Magasanikbacteria bacterium RIFCSPHIGHO2_02_FULL_41_13]|uniref:Uncharacterized protein n=1 Tax=Candidatus Magasanikbacteria bacterium RIFCSPHIGHO2_02_FULL_41_13 TaxID=1798676 RepID=A0A1F6M2Q2_9BACT|nr:MAG: hypothetical protein A3B90_03185 [Candidatus Magasanikbacteria bacterium RIFCSPHIGHO2_02_FULL_41_13]
MLGSPVVSFQFLSKGSKMSDLNWFKFRVLVSNEVLRDYEALCVREYNDGLFLTSDVMLKRALAWQSTQPKSFHTLADLGELDFLWEHRDRFPYAAAEVCVLLTFIDNAVHYFRWDGERWIQARRKMNDVWVAERAYVL